MPRPDTWSPEENAILIDGFLQLFKAELLDQPVEKAALEREIVARLPRLSLGAVKWKLRNVSAAMLDLNYCDLGGYRPAWNYQRATLGAAVVDRIALDPEVDMLMQAAVAEGPVMVGPIERNLLDILEERPASRAPGNVKTVREAVVRPRRMNWLEVEARRRDLGAAGEELVLRYEVERLHRGGQRRLADRVEQVSASKGDGLGYDIHSFDVSGQDRLIEVKTTNGGVYTPFLVTRNEVSVSAEREEQYHLYRLHSFARAPRLYTLQGSMNVTCDLDPIVYQARVA